MAKSKKDPNFPMQGKRGGMGGQYGSKSTNLSKKTLKAAGAAKAATKRSISQSDTVRVGSRTTDRLGKAITGTVTLQDGSKAVYKNGRRVQAADARKPKAASSSSSRSQSPRPAAPPAKPPAARPPKVGTIRKGAAGNKYNRWDGKRWVPVAAARTAGSDRPGRSAAQAIADTRPAVTAKPTVSGNTTKPRVAGSIAAKQARPKPAGRRTPKVAVAAYNAKKTARQTRRNVTATASRVPTAARKILENLWYN